MTKKRSSEISADENQEFFRENASWSQGGWTSLLTGSRPWCGGACVSGRPPICASSAALSSLSSCAIRRTLRSSVHGNLVVPFARSATMQIRSFSVIGPKTWNGLPLDLRHLPNGACPQFHHLLKTVLFRLAWVGSTSE